MAERNNNKVSLDTVKPNYRRGGDMRVLLSPRTVGSTSGFMGTLVLSPGQHINEHYHPYSEEFLYVVRGKLMMRVDGDPVSLEAGDALLVPKNARHRLENDSDIDAFVVFHLGPLAPRPELGHVDTEEPDGAEHPQLEVGGTP